MILIKFEDNFKIGDHSSGG